MVYKDILLTTKRSNGVNTKKFIILHHTASKMKDDLMAEYLAYNTAEVSCHYVIGVDGAIYKIGTDNDILWHAGISSWQGLTDLNKHSIGIEVNSDGKTFTDAQRKATKELVLHLIKEYDIPHTNVLRHKDIAPNRKTDIGDTFWNTDYKTYADYQLSLTNPPMNLLSDRTIKLLQQLHPVAPTELKLQIEQLAKDIRAYQLAAGEPVTK